MFDNVTYDNAFLFGFRQFLNRRATLYYPSTFRRRAFVVNFYYSPAAIVATACSPQRMHQSIWHRDTEDNLWNWMHRPCAVGWFMCGALTSSTYRTSSTPYRCANCLHETRRPIQVAYSDGKRGINNVVLPLWTLTAPKHPASRTPKK